MNPCTTSTTCLLPLRPLFVPLPTFTVHLKGSEEHFFATLALSHVHPPCPLLLYSLQCT